MTDQIPLATIQTLARTIFKEAKKYGFRQLDMIRLVNELMDYCADEDTVVSRNSVVGSDSGAEKTVAESLPIASERIIIRSLDASSDLPILKTWMSDSYGRHFVLSSTSAQTRSIEDLVLDNNSQFGIVTTCNGRPIGALAYLNYDMHQHRAELRKLIGVSDYRGKGYAEEATRLWLEFGLQALRLDKIYVSTLQANLGNIRLNERVGFEVEGLLRDEVMIDGIRHDVLRMGYCRPR